MKNILIVEDDIDVHNLIKNILKNEPYNTFSTYSGSEALMLLEKEHIDLILLDLLLPGLSGEDIIQYIKDIPTIVISAKISIEDKINLLLKGANDYITKPFNSDELLARIKVQLRLQKNNKIDNTIKYKDLRLDINSHILFLANEKIYLTRTEYAILKQLLLNPKQVISKTKLLELISNDTLDCDEDSLKVHISNIRKKIKNVTSKEYIESVWGIGFKIYD